MSTMPPPAKKARKQVCRNVEADHDSKTKFSSDDALFCDTCLEEGAFVCAVEALRNGELYTSDAHDDVSVIRRRRVNADNRELSEVESVSAPTSPPRAAPPAPR